MSITPRYYQREARDAGELAWDAGYKRPLLHLGTGGGKTHIIADMIGARAGRSLFLADQEELCRQPLRVIQRSTGIIPALHKAKQKASLRAKVIVGSAQTLARKGGLDYFPPDFFDQIFVDECFPAGTMVGGKRIEEIKVGDMVDSWCDERGHVKAMVVRRFACRPTKMVSVSIDGQIINCTAGHRFLTNRGWVMASLLTEQDSVLSIVEHGIQMPPLPETVHANIQPASEDKRPTKHNVLSGMSEYPSLYSPEGIQSNERQSDCPRKVLNVVTGDGVETNSPRREWTSTNGNRATPSMRSGMGYAHSDSNSGKKRIRIPLQLQGGCGQSEAENSNRDRREFPPRYFQKSSRQKERESTNWARVEGVEILKSGSDGVFSEVCSDGLVYNLHVEETETYTVGDGLVVHNCHRGSDRDKSILDYFTKALVYGVTATPYRSNLADLSKYYDVVAYSKPLHDTVSGGGLIAEGFAPPFDVQYLPIEIDLSSIDKNSRTPDGVEYNAEQVDSTIKPHLDEIARQLSLAGAGERHGIAFTTLVETSKAFAACLRNHGITAMHVDGQSPDRDEVIERFSRGEFSWLCNAGLVSTGVDIPIADSFLNLRLTKSMAYYQQAFGRVERVLPGVVDDLPEEDQAEERKARIAASAKPRVIVYDILVQHDRLGVCHPGHLVCANEQDARAMFEASKKIKDPQDVLEMQKKFRAEREAELIRALERAAARRDISKLLGADECLSLLGKSHLINYEGIQKWESDPVTFKQKDVLNRFGIDPESVKNKGVANRIIPEMKFRFEHGYATMKQLRYISRCNAALNADQRIKGAHKMSIAEASAVIDANKGSLNLARHEREKKTGC